MVKWVVGLVAAIVAALFGAAGVAAASAPALLSPSTYTYDGQHRAELTRDSALERGPPSTTYDYAVKLVAVDHGSDGASARPDTLLAYGYTAYDLLAALAHIDNRTRTTELGAWAAGAVLSSLPHSHVAAKSESGLAGRLAMRNERGAIGVPGGASRLTNAQAADMAARVGYTKTNYIVRGQTVFTDGKTFIVQDTTSHSGGLWTMGKSVDALNSKGTRMGTYDYDLNYIGP